MRYQQEENKRERASSGRNDMQEVGFNDQYADGGTFGRMTKTNQQAKDQQINYLDDSRPANGPPMQQQQPNTTLRQQEFNHLNGQIAAQNQQINQIKRGSIQTCDFESVFDTLRMLESREGQDYKSLHWKVINKAKVKLIQNHQQLQQSMSSGTPKVNSTPNDSNGINASKEQNKLFERNEQSVLNNQGINFLDPLKIDNNLTSFKSGWLYYLKKANSNSGDSLKQSSPNNNERNQGANIVLDQETYAKMIQKRYFYIFRKGKLYQFLNETSEVSIKYLDIRNCMIDLVTMQRPDQTTGNSASCNIDQAIQITCLGQSFYFLSGVRSSTNLMYKDVESKHYQSQPITPSKRREQLQSWFKVMKQYCTQMNLKSFYEIGNMLGKGNFAKVYEAKSLNGNHEVFALKTIEKKVLSKSKRSFLALLQEVTLLRKLDHENIIKLHEVFESSNNVHLVLEHLNGGELFERIRQKGQYSENDASIIMRCLMRALVAMHEKNIVHRDLKPENMLFKNESIDSLKIVDFGLSASTKEGLLTMRCGSPGYVAPEILNDIGYDCKVDIFSAGIILYILLTGKFVFSGKNYKEILQKNKECIVPFPPQYWEKLSTDAKDLVQQMLQKNPQNRLSAIDVLKHPWFGLNNPITHHFLQINFDEVGEANLTDDEPSLSTSVNLHLITTSPIWNKSKMRDMIRRVNQEQDKLNTFQTPAPNPRFGLNEGMIKLKFNKNKESQHKIINGGIVMQNIYLNHQQAASHYNQSNISGINKITSADATVKQGRGTLPHDESSVSQNILAHPHPMVTTQDQSCIQSLQTPTLSSKMRGAFPFFISNNNVSHTNPLSVNQSQKSNNKQQPTIDQNSTKMEGDEKNAQFLQFLQQHSSSQRSSMNRAPGNILSNSISNKILEPDIEKALKKWQDPQGIHNNNILDKVEEDLAAERAYSLLQGEKRSSQKESIPQDKEKSSSSGMNANGNLSVQVQQEYVEGVQGQCLQSSDDSSISGPIDMEENVSSVTENKGIVAAFQPHSNKNLLRKSDGIRQSSPILIRNFDSMAPNKEILLTQNASVKEKMNPQFFGQDYFNPAHLQPRNQVSSLSPGNSRHIVFGGGVFLHNPNIIIPQNNLDTNIPTISNKNSGNPSFKLSGLRSGLQNQGKNSQIMNFNVPEVGQKEEESINPNLQTNGDEDFEECVDSQMKVIVPNTPGGLQGGSRNLLFKNSINLKAVAPLLKYTQVSYNQPEQVMSTAKSPYEKHFFSGPRENQPNRQQEVRIESIIQHKEELKADQSKNELVILHKEESDKMSSSHIQNSLRKCQTAQQQMNLQASDMTPNFNDNISKGANNFGNAIEGYTLEVLSEQKQYIPQSSEFSQKLKASRLQIEEIKTDNIVIELVDAIEENSLKSLNQYQSFPPKNEQSVNMNQNHGMQPIVSGMFLNTNRLTERGSKKQLNHTQSVSSNVPSNSEAYHTAYQSFAELNPNTMSAGNNSLNVADLVIRMQKQLSTQKQQINMNNPGSPMIRPKIHLVGSSPNTQNKNSSSSGAGAPGFLNNPPNSEELPKQNIHQSSGEDCQALLSQPMASNQNNPPGSAGFLAIYKQIQSQEFEKNQAKNNNASGGIQSSGVNINGQSQNSRVNTLRKTLINII